MFVVSVNEPVAPDVTATDCAPFAPFFRVPNVVVVVLAFALMYTKKFCNVVVCRILYFTLASVVVIPAAPLPTARM